MPPVRYCQSVSLYHGIRPVSSPEIAGFPAILSPSENTGIFFFLAQTCQHFFRSEFADILFRSDIAGIFFFFFLPEIAGIFSNPKLPAYVLTQNCRHILRPEIAGIFSDPKLPAYFPTRNSGHIFQPEIRGLISNLKLLAFFRPDIGASKSSSSFLLSVQ